MSGNVRISEAARISLIKFFDDLSHAPLYCSTSSADSLNWLFFSFFLRIYYLYSSKIVFVFVPVKIFRVKIEPVGATIFSLSALIYIPLALYNYYTNKEIYLPPLNFSNIAIMSGCVGVNFMFRFNIPMTFLAFFSISLAVCSLVNIR